ncbi:MAG: pyrroline-5-carboxylate reductase [Pseudomonadota bacterium]|nr:pyrroline-5-carboxylate reductase [Pseudomonadota bacterium]
MRLLRTLMAMGITAFIGGGNMATAIVGGLRRSGMPAGALIVLEPNPAQREQLAANFGVRTLAAADASLREAATVVWAVKPQLFRAVAAPVAAHVGSALQLSVMAGVGSAAIGAATATDRVVRAMPNTPALIGQGIAGLYARAAVDAADKAAVEAVLAPTGCLLWFDRETDLDAVTALSGSGPAYVFYFAEAMVRAAVEMGLTEAQGRELALATFAGASALAAGSTDALHVLRERVTSKGGTTQAAIESLAAAHVDSAIGRALHAAHDRAQQLGSEFG